MAGIGRLGLAGAGRRRRHLQCAQRLACRARAVLALGLDALCRVLADGAGLHALIGVAALGAPLAPSAGLHLLTVGAMGVSIFAVLCIAGQHPCRIRARPAAVGAGGGYCALQCCAGARCLRLPGLPLAALRALSGAAWVLGYGLAAIYLGAVFMRARPDAELEAVKKC